jgi:hypothetical protein
MTSRAQDGTKARARAYYGTRESFTASELAAFLGKPERTVYRLLANEMQDGAVFAGGRKGGGGLRRYTLDAALAARLTAEAEPKPLTESAMRRKIGACLGGLSDLESLRIRCITDPEDDDVCWMWTGAMTGEKGRLPTAQLPGKKSGSVLRWAFETFKKPIPAKHIVWRKCCAERCCNPKHLLSGSRQDWGAWVKKNKVWAGKITYMLSGRRAALKRTVITQDVLDRIEELGETTEQAATRIGVHPSSISRAIRKHSPLVPQASVFTFKAAA